MNAYIFLKSVREERSAALLKALQDRFDEVSFRTEPGYHSPGFVQIRYRCIGYTDTAQIEMLRFAEGYIAACNATI